MTIFIKKFHPTVYGKELLDVFNRELAKNNLNNIKLSIDYKGGYCLIDECLHIGCDIDMDHLDKPISQLQAMLLPLNQANNLIMSAGGNQDINKAITIIKSFINNHKWYSYYFDNRSVKRLFNQLIKKDLSFLNDAFNVNFDCYDMPDDIYIYYSLNIYLADNINSSISINFGKYEYSHDLYLFNLNIDQISIDGFSNIKASMLNKDLKKLIKDFNELANKELKEIKHNEQK